MDNKKRTRRDLVLISSATKHSPVKRVFDRIKDCICSWKSAEGKTLDTMVQKKKGGVIGRAQTDRQTTEIS